MDLPPPVADVPAAFSEAVIRAFDERPGPRFALVLSGGSTARACYEHLAATTGGGHPDVIDWSLVDIYMGDERYVAPDDADANQRLVREALLDSLGPRGDTRPQGRGTFTPMPTTLPIDDCAAAYQDTMAELLADGGIDLIHLGLGPDGHTASLFPNSPTLETPPTQLVAATEDPNGQNPYPRLTLTVSAINVARLVVFTVTGASKADAVAALRRGDDIPAAQVQAERVQWLLDAAAATPSP
jgi:6-phosphogluconolactonase